MDTISTLIEFAEKSNPQENVPATGDFISVAIILAAVVFAIGSFIFVRMQNKSLVTGKHVVKSAKKNPLTATFVILAGLLLAVGLISNVSNAIAGPNGIASATEKVYAYVDTETGEVSFENGYIKSNVPQDVNSVAVKVDMLDSPEFSYNFNWQVKIGDEVVYNGVAQDLKHDFYIDVKDAKTSFEITNLSVSDAKALIGREVAKVSFCATTLLKIQSDAYFEIYDKVDAALDGISEIPTTSLLDEDRAAAKANISKILDDSFLEISETEDTAKLAEIVSKAQGDIQALSNNARSIAIQTVMEKTYFASQKGLIATNLQNKVTNSDLLTAEDKTEFNSQIDIIIQQDLPYINSITSRAELESKEANISSRLESLDASIKAKIEERFKEYKDAAIVTVIQQEEDGKVEIDKIDNLSEGKKTAYKAKIGETASTVQDALDIATTKTEIDNILAGCTQSILAIIKEADDLAHHPWTLKTWEPVTVPSIAPKDSYIFDAIAEVDDSDEYRASAPAPAYQFKEDTANVDYFTIETTADSKAKINVAEGTPEGRYYVTVYATFGSIVDTRYITKTNEVEIRISVWNPRSVADPSASEIVLGNYVNKPRPADGYTLSAYLLEDGGTELHNVKAQPGDILNFYLYRIPTAPAAPSEYWTCELWGGHWGETWFTNICEPGYPGAAEEGRTEYDLPANNGVYSVELTHDMLMKAYDKQWWGGSFVLCGTNIACARVTITHTKAPSEITLDEGEWVLDNWGNASVVPSETFTSANPQPGSYLNFYIADLRPGEDWYFQVFLADWLEGVMLVNTGSWGYNIDYHLGVYSLLLTEENIQLIKDHFDGGKSLALNGNNSKCTKVTLSSYPY